ncbi:MAG: ABC transporter ATP-binding protein/permease [Clostridiales bacterium]|jgi:ATP-binding cassette subfamily B protein|nr:ABC transporter ATP-binding protein/permease [Clostridiales bacterium]
MARNRFFEDEPAKNKFNLKMLLRVLRYAIPYKKSIIAIFCVMIAMGFLGLLPVLLNGMIMDTVLPQKENWLQMAIICVSGIAAVQILDAVYTFLRSRIMAKNGYKIVRDIRRDLFTHLQKLSFDFYDSRPAGKILVRVTNYVDELANIFASSVIGMIVDGIKIILLVLWMLILDWRLALIAILAFAPFVLLISKIQKTLQGRHRIHRNNFANRTAYIAENVNGTAVTKAFNREAANLDIYNALNVKSNRSWARVISINETIWPSMDFALTLSIMLVYVLAIAITTGAINIGGGLSLGTITSFTLYMGMFSAPINNIATIIQQLVGASANIERILETVDTKPTVIDFPDCRELPPVKGDVTFENVVFEYEKHIHILENFSIDVPAGKCIALVGPTGAGKTTVVNLISRFYDATEGRVLIDGIDVKSVSQQSLRRQVGVMMQDTFIFSGSILENIRYSRPEATDEECIAAAVTVGADTFIKQLPDGYHTVTLENGAGLSTGERQLISFARTLLSDPKILILDEATSSIDTETETLIQNALNATLTGRTTFVIAHRLSTISRADCILYIADKGIQEAGTHAQLMEKKGKYYDLTSKK